MIKTAMATLSLPESLFSRFVALVDHALNASARIAIRNGDLPYFGL